MNKPFRAALFDLDGTLIDSLDDICEALNQLRMSRHLPSTTPSEIRKWVGRGAEFLVQGTLPELSREELPDASALYIQNYLNLKNPSVRLYPGVESTLGELQSRGYCLGIVTNKASASADAVLKKLLPNISFSEVAGPERVSYRKPHPAHLLEVLKRMRVEPAQAFFVGDDPVDQGCAKAAGVQFFGACYGFGHIEHGHDTTLERFQDILSAVE